MTHRLFINFYTAYADVFEGLGEIKGVQRKIQIDPDANLACSRLSVVGDERVGFLWPFASLLK